MKKKKAKLKKSIDMNVKGFIKRKVKSTALMAAGTIIPIASSVLINKYINGKFYIKISGGIPPEILSKFFDNDCTAMYKPNLYHLGEFNTATNSCNDKENNFSLFIDPPIYGKLGSYDSSQTGMETHKAKGFARQKLQSGISGDHHEYSSFLSAINGNIFISKNKSLIITLDTNRKKKNKPKRSLTRMMNDAAIYIIGLNFEKDLEIIKTYMDSMNSYTVNHIMMHELSLRNHIRSYTTLRVKSLDDVFSDQKEIIFNSIDKILYKFTVSGKFVIGSTSAIVLHGIPGTGKSLLARCICNYIKMKGTYDDVNPMYISSNKDDICEVMDDIHDNLRGDINILMIDDCDIVMRPRDSGNDKKSQPNITSRIMKILDNGIGDDSNPLLIIMTTNYINNIDSAILRPGRTDALIEVTNICHDTATAMCEKYNISIDDVIKTFPEIYDNDRLINPAHLQQCILSLLMGVE